MKVTVKRSVLLKPLQMVSGVVERKQTMPILANVLLTAKDNTLSLTATDLELELIGTVGVEEVGIAGATTVSARKLLDICRALPDEAILTLEQEGAHVVLRSGRSRFLLATLPAEEFPAVESATFTTELSISESRLRKLASSVHFAMGQQDVRHYLNGALFDIDQGSIKCVATDGHRLAFSQLGDIAADIAPVRVILPRKSVIELMRLLDANSDERVQVSIGENHFRVQSADFTFTSRLVMAQYPDYERLIPRQAGNRVLTGREALRQALVRASILSGDKFRGVRLQLDNNLLRVVANNPEQEEAEDSIQMDYQGDPMEIGFNVAYLLDVVSSMAADQIQWSFNNPDGGVLMESSVADDSSLYVVMPMRL